MSEHDKLREAIKWARSCAKPEPGPPGSFIAMVTTLADAAESTLPRTKMVEVWRVEEARPVNGGWLPVIHNFLTKAEADVHAAESMMGDEREIRVTGPHMQEVPA